MTAERKMEVLLDKNEERHIVLAPGVGYYSERPGNHSFLTGGAFAGKIKILNTYYDLHLPSNISGEVNANEKADLVIPVEYGQELFRLNTEKALLRKGETFQDAEIDSQETESDIHEEGFVVTAFTTGVFYAKPSPDAPPFVSVGQEIEKGKALGLIEVMKTFNHIIFQGTDNSERGKIKKIFVEDSQEVKLGEPLFVIE